MSNSLKDLFKISQELNPKVVQKLLVAIKNNQTDEFDYLRFKQSFEALLGMGIDNQTAAKSAFITASTMGLTKDKLLKSIEFYKSVLNKEKDEFANALKYQISSNIDAKTLQLNALQKKIEEHQTKMEQLKKEIENMKTEIENTKNTIDDASQKINQTRINFKSTFDHLYEEIEKDAIFYNTII